MVGDGTVRSAGPGLLDCSTAGERLDLAAPALDVKPVLEACDAGAAVLFGVTFGRPVWQLLDRAQALVLAGGFAKMTRLGEFDFEAGPARVDEWASVIARVWSWAMMFGAGPASTAHLVSRAVPRKRPAPHWVGGNRADPQRCQVKTWPGDQGRGAGEHLHRGLELAAYL